MCVTPEICIELWNKVKLEKTLNPKFQLGHSRKNLGLAKKCIDKAAELDTDVETLFRATFYSCKLPASKVYMQMSLGDKSRDRLHKFLNNEYKKNQKAVNTNHNKYWENVRDNSPYNKEVFLENLRKFGFINE